MRPRRNRPLFIIDIAVPRDVEPAVGNLDQVFLYNIDDLQTIVKENLARRGGELERAEAIVDEEVSRFAAWMQSREIIPTVVALRQRFEAIRQSELARLEPKLSGLPPEARARVDEITRLIVEKLLLTPTEQLKAVSDEAMVVAYADALNRLFSLAQDQAARESPEKSGPRCRRDGDADRDAGQRARALAGAGRRRPARGRRTPVELVVITTTGDRLQEAPLSAEGGKRLFVKEIEDALLAGEIDLAVHSAKDMSAVLPEGLDVAATLPREDPRDAVVLRDGIRTQDFAGALAHLGEGPAIGTSSVRRIAQLAPLVTRARFAPIRGNVDTRLRKLDAGEFDALVLAAAGMRRLGVGARISAPIPIDACVPAPGQGIVAIEIRQGDDARARPGGVRQRCRGGGVIDGGAGGRDGARRRLSAAARRHRAARARHAADARRRRDAGRSPRDPPRGRRARWATRPRSARSSPRRWCARERWRYWMRCGLGTERRVLL